jgi:hypothetical protein
MRTLPPSELRSKRGYARSAERQKSRLEDPRGWRESPVQAAVLLEVRVLVE